MSQITKVSQSLYQDFLTVTKSKNKIVAFEGL